MGLLMEGEEFIENLDPICAWDELTLHGDPKLDINKKQGSIRLSLSEFFLQSCAIFIIRYFTCEGWYSFLHFVHFKFLSCLRHDNRSINVPSFVFNILSKQVVLVQEGRWNIVSHHCLIELIVEKSLNEKEDISWEEFLLWLFKEPIPKPIRCRVG